MIGWEGCSLRKRPNESNPLRKVLIAVVLLVLSAYIVPFVFLNRIHAWYGSFLCWILFALAVMGLIVRSTRTWRDS